jgi:carbon monoxide dehydrogenase subunit G
MPSVTKTVELGAAPDEAFRLATDPSRFSEWLTIHDSWPQGEPGAPEQGAQFVQKIRVMGMPADVNWTVEELSDSRMVLKGAGPMGATVSNVISVASSDAGSSVSYEAEFSGGGIQGPMGDMVTQQAGNELEKSLAKLKELAS